MTVLKLQHAKNKLHLHDMTKQTIETNLIYRPIVMILL